ncbi:MAG: adenylyltransferase/cytidyltransferase family protein [Flavobacteriales bacterium]|nr:adenylyltransferase/cytidyltransferase family protein [Flavobacteriales bacterium]MCB9174653.1 adenylyltransferase/cytidyltransferase family protein [Flavobacteriales bacterium]
MNKLQNIKSKIVDLKQLEKLISTWKSDHQQIVFTNGCFDIIHRGHVEYLAEASDLGNKFILAVNSDASVKRLEKGSSRPIQDEYSRALIVAAFKFVDAVIIFDEQTPIELIQKIVPDVLVKGGDYDPNCTDKTEKKYIVGSDVVKANSGRVEVIKFVPGFSTSKIEAKIRTCK